MTFCVDALFVWPELYMSNVKCDRYLNEDSKAKKVTRKNIRITHGTKKGYSH